MKKLSLVGDVIVHKMKITFDEPVKNYQSVVLRALPRPTDRENEYERLNLPAEVSVFVGPEGQTKVFEDCETKKTVKICSIERNTENFDDKNCYRALLDDDAKGITGNCTKLSFQGGNCLVNNVQKGALVISTTTSIPIFEEHDRDLTWVEEKPVKVCTKMCLVKEQNIRFICEGTVFAIAKTETVNITVKTLEDSSLDLHLGHVETEKVDLDDFVLVQKAQKYHLFVDSIVTVILIVISIIFIVKWILNIIKRSKKTVEEAIIELRDLH